MSDMLDQSDEAAIGLLRTFASSLPPRSPDTVVAAVVSSTSRTRGSRVLGSLSLAPVALAILVIGALSAGGYMLVTGDAGSRGSDAIVNGTKYDVSITRSLSFPDGVLVPYAELASVEGGFQFIDNTAYLVPGISPQNALVLRLAPGQHDDEPLGDYLLLVRGEEPWAQLCKYFDPLSAATPAVCR